MVGKVVGMYELEANREKAWNFETMALKQNLTSTLAMTLQSNLVVDALLDPKPNSDPNLVVDALLDPKPNSDPNLVVGALLDVSL